MEFYTQTSRAVSSFVRLSRTNYLNLDNVASVRFLTDGRDQFRAIVTYTAASAVGQPVTEHFYEEEALLLQRALDDSLLYGEAPAVSEDDAAG